MLYSYGVYLPRAEVVAGQSLEVRQEISAVASPVKDIVVPVSEPYHKVIFHWILIWVKTD